PKKWAPSFFTVARAKYGFFLAVGQLAKAGRSCVSPVAFGASPSRYLAWTVLPWLSGMVIEPNGAWSGVMPFLPIGRRGAAVAPSWTPGTASSFLPSWLAWV